MSNKYVKLPAWLEFMGMVEVDGKPVMRVRVKWWAVPMHALYHLWAKLRGQPEPWP